MASPIRRLRERFAIVSEYDRAELRRDAAVYADVIEEHLDKLTAKEIEVIQPGLGQGDTVNIRVPLPGLASINRRMEEAIRDELNRRDPGACVSVRVDYHVRQELSCTIKPMSKEEPHDIPLIDSIISGIGQSIERKREFARSERVVLQDIPLDMTNDQLLSILNSVGPVQDLHRPMGKNKGYCDYETADVAHKATLLLRCVDLDDGNHQTIRVMSQAEWHQERAKAGPRS
jgi:hypothetical protein